MTAKRSNLKNLAERVAIAAFLLLVLLSLPFASIVLAQKQQPKKSDKSSERKQLEAKRQKLQKDIAFFDKQLKETRRSKSRSMLELVSINKKIEMREDLITTINGEISVIETQISTNKDSISQLEKEVARLKNDYKQMLRFAYRNRGPEQRLLFIFAADDINQAFRRLRYVRRLNDSRRNKALQLTERQADLNKTVAGLVQKRQDKSSLLDNEKTEKDSLSNEKVDKEKVFAGLQSKEKELKDEIDAKKKLASQYDQTIKDLIAEEIKRQQAKPKTPKPKSGSNSGNSSSGNSTASSGSSSSTTTTTTSGGIELTPEGKILSTSFEGNKGSLSWPVLQGQISEHYGRHPHPVLKDVEVNNNGVDILTTKGSNANVIFDGEVTGVASIPGHGKLVIVRHGEYLSVYANIESTTLKVGDKVKKGQLVGKVIFDSEDSKTELHLEIWKGQTILNPELWLARK